MLATVNLSSGNLDPRDRRVESYLQIAEGKTCAETEFAHYRGDGLNGLLKIP
ncbi:hypothetical protein NTGBS_950013 [Candidatus Nitrotoga sp. BS]|nr:hypothetical protein NTGBS_950013 [Candidatus Nitrotoga sp. BS]